MLENKLKIGCYCFEKAEQRSFIGSSRIRGEWLVKYWQGAELYKYGETYDVIIYQKAYLPEHAKAFKGIKIFDLCDPDFLHWGYRFIEMINECNAITTSTQELADLIKNYTSKPVVFIPDRHDLEFYKTKKEHKGEAKSVAWFGYSTGFVMLEQVLPLLVKNNLELIVIADKPYTMPKSYEGKIKVTNYSWSVNTVNDDILKADFVVNPQAKKGKWRFKSNNKTISAYLLNMPVAENAKHLEKLIDEKFRQEEAEKSRLMAEKEYDIKLSVLDYQDLISKLKKNA